MGRLFFKEHVKSLSTDGGSLVEDINRIPEVIAKMRKYRGHIEGGLCVCQIESFIPKTEQRHFVFRGTPHSLNVEVPEVVAIAAQKINSPFFTVDTIKRNDGVIRIVELGDGQVSDLKSWNAEQFIALLAQ